MSKSSLRIAAAVIAAVDQNRGDEWLRFCPALAGRESFDQREARQEVGRTFWGDALLGRDHHRALAGVPLAVLMDRRERRAALRGLDPQMRAQLRRGWKRW